MSGYMQFGHRQSAAHAKSHTVLLIDVSASMEEGDYPPTRLGAAIEASNALLDVKASTYPEDRVGIVTFSDVITIVHPLVRVASDAPSLRTAIGQIRAGGNTAMTDGLTMSVGLLSGGRGSQTCLQQIILLTDGEHNTGPDPVTYAQDAKITGFTIDVIGIGTPSGLDHTCLRSIASVQPDGSPSYCFIGDSEHLSKKLRELAHYHIQPL
jgi:Mg-chelatase subunit ChlD